MFINWLLHREVELQKGDRSLRFLVLQKLSQLAFILAIGLNKSARTYVNLNLNLAISLYSITCTCVPLTWKPFTAYAVSTTV